jgi:hypothetical protein
MYAATMIRELKFDQLRQAQLTVRHILEMTPRKALAEYRDDGLGWNVTEVLCHLRDFESVFLERAQLTANDDFPDLPFPDPDQLALDHKYGEEQAWPAFEDWQRRRLAHLEFLESLDEEAWERAGNHPTRGRFTLNQQLMLTAWHDVNHLEQITRILAEKK